MRVVGTQNAHNLISISTDGKLCSWSLDMLAQPQEFLELQQRQGKAVAATCLSFPAGDVNNFVVGSEEGNVYTACRHGSRAGVLDVFEGHQVSWLFCDGVRPPTSGVYPVKCSKNLRLVTDVEKLIFHLCFRRPQ